MFDKLIEIAVKSALENPEIKGRLERKKEEIRIDLIEQNKKNKTIDLKENEVGMFEAK